MLRHAKSSWGNDSLADRDRPLAERGHHDARRMDDYLRANELRPDLVLCSPARRTRETLELVAGAVAGAETTIEAALYGAEAPEILAVLHTIEPAHGCVMIIGHNPGLEDLVMDLAGDGDPTAMDQLRTKFPTAALAVLDLGETGWPQLAPGSGYLARLVLPRHLH